jgi:hypothetical protein
LLHEHTECGGHGDATVLDFDTAVVAKVFWSTVWTVLDQTERTVVVVRIVTQVSLKEEMEWNEQGYQWAWGEWCILN